MTSSPAPSSPPSSRPGRHRRPRRRWPLVLAWLLAAVAAVGVVKGTRIGPVVLVVDEQRGWGVHTGDSLAAVPLVLAGWYQLRGGRRRR